MRPWNNREAILLPLFVSFALLLFAYPDAALSKEERAPELIRVIRDGQTKKIDKLLKKNPDVNVRDAYGWTPVMYAVLRKDMATAVKLLSRGADPNLQDRDGVTPLIAAILEAPYPFMIPYLTGNEKLATDLALLLISKGADPNLADKEGSTPLIYAVNREQGGIVEALLKKGADPNRADLQGRTPLFFVNHPDKFREWAPAGALGCNLRVRGIPSDESLFPPQYAAQVQVARQQAAAPREENKAAIASLLREAGASAPDAAAVTASENNLLDRRPQRLRMGPSDPTMLVTLDYMRTAQQDISYRMLVLVASDGTVKSALVISGLPDGGSERLQKAALKLRYQPALKNNRPVEAWDLVVGGGTTRISFRP